MLKKRLIGVITIKNGWAVQSFGYERYLPLGRPEVLAENLDRWGADEIVLQCIDRSKGGFGPDLDTLKKVASKGLGTPIIYIGGVRTLEDGMKVIQSGADRLALDSLLHDSPEVVVELSHKLGAQALIGSVPLSMGDSGARLYDYRVGEERDFSSKFLDLIKAKVISELMVIDWQGDGHKNGFKTELLETLPVLGLPLIVFGGLSSAKKVRQVLSRGEVSAAAVGNFLNYKEHAIAEYKKQLSELPIRMISASEM